MVLYIEMATYKAGDLVFVQCLDGRILEGTVTKIVPNNSGDFWQQTLYVGNESVMLSQISGIAYAHQMHPEGWDPPN